MVAGLGAAGIEHPECKLNVVTGMRQDLMRVKDGMERIKRIPVNKAFIRRGLIFSGKKILVRVIILLLYKHWINCNSMVL